MDLPEREGISLWEEATRERFVPILRWIVQSLNHVRLLGLVAENTPRSLILVDECQLTACLIQQDLMDHAISPTRVDNSTVQREEPSSDHYRQHYRVGPVEWILLNEDGKYDERDNESREEQRNRVPSLAMQVENEKAILKFK